MKIKLPDLPGWTVPIALFVLLVGGFGIFLPVLGFYWDDWPLILTGHFQGPAGFWQYWQFDRPFSAWTYAALFPLLDETPLKWHIASLLLRWAAAVAMWWVLIRTWPRYTQVIAWACMLFAVYPVFSQQPIAVTYSQHWMIYLFYFVSFGAMIQAYRSPRWFLPLTGLALATSLVQAFSMEYFLGLELLRPLFLWVLYSEQDIHSMERLKKVLLAWLPYLIILVLVILWRVFLIQLPGNDRNAPTMFLKLAADPVSGLLKLVQMALQDVSFIVITSWYATFQPGNFDLSSRFSISALVIGLFITVLVAGFLFSLKTRDETNAEKKDGDLRAFLLTGGLLVLASPLPAWITERQVIQGAYSDRLAIPAMFGVSILLAGLAAWALRSRVQKILFISLLVGLAVSNSYRIANDFRWARIQQNRFYWQLSWRAPAIEPLTAIFAEAEVLPKTGLYATASGINLLYAGPDPTGGVPYWFFSLSREYSYRMPELLGGMPLDTRFRQFHFSGDSRSSLIVYYKPDYADCLRVLTPEDTHDPALSALEVQALPISSLPRILPSQPAGSNSPSPDLFGPEPEHGWCYYFQKAGLARQLGDWQKVTELGDQAKGLGFNLQNTQSNTPQEWLPFIEGYANTGRWDDAYSLSQSVFEKEPRMAARLCDLWDTIKQANVSTGEADKALLNLNCGS